MSENSPRQQPARRRRTSAGGRAGPQDRPLRPEDLWRPRSELPPPEPIRPADDPTALLRSLGDPPLPGNRQATGHYLATVAERAAVLATALAASADLLEDPDEV